MSTPTTTTTKENTKSNGNGHNHETFNKLQKHRQQLFSLNYFVVILVGSLIRILLSNAPNLKRWLEHRVEIATPLTSWNRVLEGIFIKDSIGLASAYESDLVHEIPVMLKIYKLLLALFGNQLISYAFILVDILSATLMLMLAPRIINHMTRVETIEHQSGKYKRLIDSFESEEECIKTMDTFLINTQTLNPTFWSHVAFAVLFLNPFSICSCVAQSTIVIHNFILLLWFCFLLNNQTILSFFFLALHANITVYSLVFVVPSISFLIQKSVTHSLAPHKTNKLSIIIQHLALFFTLTALVFGFNLFLEDNSTRFIESTYLFILKVPDLIPNLGVFWYFFTEMFEHFRLFFTYVFQINVFIYTIPLTIRLRNDPIVNIFIQLGLISCLKSYPSVGETGFYLSFLPLLSYLFAYMRNIIVYSVMLIVSTILAPIMFYLWLGGGGGNANFYFAITLVYSIGQIFLLVDIFYASLKREFIKTNGAKIPKAKNGASGVFSLE